MRSSGFLLTQTKLFSAVCPKIPWLERFQTVTINIWNKGFQQQPLFGVNFTIQLVGNDNDGWSKRAIFHFMSTGQHSSGQLFMYFIYLGKSFHWWMSNPFSLLFFYIAMLWQIFPSWHFALLIIAKSCASKYLNRSIRCHKWSLAKSIKWRAASV